MKLQAVSNRKLYIQIADQIRGQILDGSVEPGRQLPSERDLALNLGVSRPTVREALIALEVAGLVEVRVGVGAFVRKPGDARMALPELSASPLEVTAVRLLLEPEAAALASQNISPEGTARLAELVRDLKRQLTLVIIEHDMRFLFGLADRVSVIHWGQVIAEGTPDQLRGNEWVRRSNLGALAA